jgi:hypothetical protein
MKEKRSLKKLEGWNKNLLLNNNRISALSRFSTQR